MSAAPALAIRGLVLHGPAGAPIVDGLDLDIAPGEIVALVGESGSGKTMAGRAVLRLLPPGVRRVAGTVEVDGREVHALDAESLRALRGGTVGMVFQEPMVSLNPAMTIGAQLVEGLVLHRRLDARAAREEAVAMLRRVQVADPEACLDSHPHRFSGGMRQRIMLASVMLPAPRLLIADEPTTALDSLTQREVMEMLVGLARAHGTAVLLVTHDLGLVARYARHVFVLCRGRCVEAGTTAGVLTAPRDPYTRRLVDALPRQRDAGASKDGATPPLIEAREVSVAFAGVRTRWWAAAPPKRVVDRVSLTIRPGEAVAVVGGSGSGKTTLGRALLGLLPLAGGEVRYRGASIAGASAAERRRFRLDAQLVFQDPYSSLDPRQTVGRIVAEPLLQVPDGAPPLDRAARRERVEAMLADVGLSGMAERHPHALSGGQRQRVAIARALVRGPAFVVADEPVSALDATIQKQVLELFRRLQAERGFACLFITHNLGVVGEVADRVIVMHAGRIVEEGRAGELLASPRDAYTRALVEAATSGDLVAELARRPVGEGAG